MTPARKHALQWFYDRGEVAWLGVGGPSNAMVKKMLNDGQLERIPPKSPIGMVKYALTDKGRSDLHEA